MALSVRGVFRAVAAPLAVAAVASGCSDAAVSKAVGSGGDGGPPIVIATSPSNVTIANHAGRPLLDVRVAIEAADAATPFLRVVPTIDGGASNEMALASFQNEDGMPLDPAAIRPTQVTVTARDTLAKTYQITLPWKN